MAKTCTACETSATTSCTICNAALCTDHVQLGQPFISARQLVTTTATMAVRAPGMLADVLFNELEQVPYCTNCREDVAAKRTSEQLKFLIGMLLMMALVIGLPLYLTMFG